MIKVLLKNQLREVFKGYFTDRKKNTARSRGGVIGWFLFFIVLMVGVMGGMFTALSLSLCIPLAEAGMSWLYFLLMGGIAGLLGIFGSVFNTYYSLYLSKDNDLLLSLPITIRDIVFSRLANVFIMGAMYSSVGIIPAVIVYWIKTGFGTKYGASAVATVIGGIVMVLVLALLVFVLACLLGWIVARISLKIKSKTVVVSLISIAFIVLYYVVYFKASNIIRDMITNAAVYGESIKGASYALYLFGRIGEGDMSAIFIYLVAAVVLTVLVCRLLLRSFLSIATASSTVKKVKYVEQKANVRTPFGAFFRKELARLFSSSNYMLNCGFGILLIPAGGIAMLIMGGDFMNILNDAFGERPGCGVVILVCALMMLSTMNNMAAPSISLEGKSLWIPKSLPLKPQMILRAKACLQIVLSGVPMLFATLCAVVKAGATPVESVLIVLVPISFTVLSSLFACFVGVRMPNLTWTNEIIPIKQSAAVMFSILGGWLASVIFVGAFLLLGFNMGSALYLMLFLLVFLGLSLYLLKWLDTKGAAMFTQL